MAAITTAHDISVEEFPASQVSGSAAPARRKNVYLKFDATGTTDTVDLNAVVNDNISSVLGLKYATVAGEPSSGTAGIDFSGTTLTSKGGAGTYNVEVEVLMK